MGVKCDARDGPNERNLALQGRSPLPSDPKRSASVCRLGAMAVARTHAEATAVVLSGSFNPRIFEPHWFGAEGLVPEQEASAAEVQLIDQDFCHVNFGWVDLIITQDRLQAETTGETVNDSQLRDLLIGIFRLLPHIPVKAGSIHHRWQIGIDDEEAWHAAGDALAPKELWSDVLTKPGMFDFAMQGLRSDDLAGSIKVRIQPSQAIRPGIFINVNNEFALAETKQEDRAIAELIETLWPDAARQATEIKDKLMSQLVH